MPPPAKWSLLVAIPPIVLALAFAFEVRPWMLALEADSTGIAGLALATGLVWGLTLWWALHHLAFQLASLVIPANREPQDHPDHPVRILILIPTRDDFSAECARSCLEQEYPREAFQVVVCDDGETARSRIAVDEFRATHGLTVLRRTGREGFKAGNLNAAFAACAGEGWDWIAIVDADQSLPRDWLAELAPVLAAQPADVAYVQAGREPLHGDPTPFQSAMQGEMLQLFERDMAARPAFGFVPFLGHGGAIRAEAWNRVGGLPMVVSEDYAFSMAAGRFGLRGEREDRIRSAEGSPVDFAAFVVRLSKFAAGAGELWFRRLPGYCLAGGRCAERWDAVMLFATYALMPFVAINLLASAYVCHVLWTADRTVLAPNLSYLFLAMFGLSTAVSISVHRKFGDAARHAFWAAAVYSAALPICALRFVWALVRRPEFRRTPKAVGHADRFAVTKWIVAVGGVAQMALAIHWWSPFSPIVLGIGSAQLLVPFWMHLHEADTRRGALARSLIYLPGAFGLAGLVRMWLWSTG